MFERKVGVLGGRSFLGEELIPILVQGGWKVFAFSRTKTTITKLDDSYDVTWIKMGDGLLDEALKDTTVPCWICLIPIFQLPKHLPLLEACGARHVIALSSTSAITKVDSPSQVERNIAARIKQGESRLTEWADSRGVDWVLLRCTMIYGNGKDSNITELAGLIARFGVFPLLGKAKGLRQPVHVADVAQACHAALTTPSAAKCAYTLSGGEAISYREMVCRIFSALNKRARFVNVPLWLFSLGLKILKLIPRYRQWYPAMVIRMNQDMAFNHNDASRDLDFQPRSFSLGPQDISKKIQPRQE